MKTKDKIEAVVEEFKLEFLAKGSECTWETYPLATDVVDWLQHHLEALVREEREDERKQLQEKYTLVPKRSKREQAKDDAWSDLGNTLRNGV